MSAPSRDEILAMQSALSEVMGMLKHGMTDFEARVWQGVIEQTRREAFENFLRDYILSPAARFGPPRPGDAVKALGLVTGGMEVDDALLMLEQSVARFGPYQSPELSHPVLIQAIHNLGGWPRVNELLPAASAANGLARKDFRDRLAAAMAQAQAELRVRGLGQVEPLRPLGAKDNLNGLVLVDDAAASRMLEHRPC